MHSTNPPFDQCPRCDYSLRGLPADHACPECGLRYDCDCEMYKALKPVPLWQTLAGFGGLLSLVNLLSSFPSWSIEWKIVSVLVGLLCVWLVVFTVRRVRTVDRQGRFVAVTGDGLFIRMQSLEPEFIPWSNITRASSTVRSRTATIFIQDKKVVRHLGGVFAKQQDADRFVKQIEARVQALRAEAPRVNN